MSVATYDTIPGSGNVVTNAGSVAYPKADVLATMAPMLLPRVYAEGLSALQLQSSGKLAFSVGDVHALDVSARPGGGTAVATAGGRGMQLRSPQSAATLDGDVAVEALRDVEIDVARGLNMRLGAADTPVSLIDTRDGPLIDASTCEVRCGDITALSNAGIVFHPNASHSYLGREFDPAVVDLEPAWRVSGPASFEYVNAATGSRLAFLWRANEMDELELVQTRDGADPELCARFGLDPSDTIFTTTLGQLVNITGAASAKAAAPGGDAEVTVTALTASVNLQYTAYALATQSPGAHTAQTVVASAHAAASARQQPGTSTVSMTLDKDDTGAPIAGSTRYTVMVAYRATDASYSTAQSVAVTTLDTTPPAVSSFALTGGTTAGVDATLTASDNDALASVHVAQYDSQQQSLTPAQVKADAQLTEPLTGASQTRSVQLSAVPAFRSLHAYAVAEDKTGNLSSVAALPAVPVPTVTSGPAAVAPTSTSVQAGALDASAPAVTRYAVALPETATAQDADAALTAAESSLASVNGVKL